MLDWQHGAHIPANKKESRTDLPRRGGVPGDVMIADSIEPFVGGDFAIQGQLESDDSIMGASLLLLLILPVWSIGSERWIGTSGFEHWVCDKAVWA